MMRAPARVRVVAAALSVWATTAPAQHPGLSGIWVLVADSGRTATTVARTGDAPFRSGEPGNGWGSPLTITQRADRLGVEYTVFSSYDLQPPLRFSFALDGQVSTNTLMIGHSASTLRSTAAWSGDTLVITTTYPGPAGADGRPVDVTVRQSLHLGSPTALVVETTRAGILGATTSTSRTTYTRR